MRTSMEESRMKREWSVWSRLAVRWVAILTMRKDLEGCRMEWLWQWSGWFCGPRGRRMVCGRLSPGGLRPMQSRHCKQRSDCMAFRLANFVISQTIPFDVLGNLAARICLALPQQRESARKQVRSTRATSANLTIRQPLALDSARLAALGSTTLDSTSSDSAASDSAALDSQAYHWLAQRWKVQSRCPAPGERPKREIRCAAPGQRLRSL